MTRLLNQDQLAEFFGNIMYDDLLAWMKEESFDLPEPLEVCGQHLWCSDDIERAVRAHFKRRRKSADLGLPEWLIAAVNRGDVGFRNGWVSVNAVIRLAERHGVTLPGGPNLTHMMRHAGYTASYRPYTSYKEAMRFGKATSQRTRLYHTGKPLFASDADAMLIYDACQE